MAGRTRKNTVAESKKDTQKAKSVLDENTVSKSAVSSKTAESKKTETVKKDVKEKTEADKVVKKAEETVAPEKVAEEKSSAAKTEEAARDLTESAEEPKKRGRKPGSKNKKKEQQQLTPEVYLQYHGEETEQNVIIEKIKEQYVADGHRAGNIRSLKLYIKPEDRAAYYVINDKYAGKVDLFNI